MSSIFFEDSNPVGYAIRLLQARIEFLGSRMRMSELEARKAEEYAQSLREEVSKAKALIADIEQTISKLEHA